MIKFLLSITTILLFFTSISHSQIAHYTFDNNLNDNISNQNGSFNPLNCCDFRDESFCNMLFSESGISVCQLPKTTSSENYLKDGENNFLKLGLYDYFKLPESVSLSIDTAQSFRLDFKFKIPSAEWTSNDSKEYVRTIIANTYHDQRATGFSINISKYYEEGVPIYELYAFAGGKPYDTMDVAGQWFRNLKNIELDKWVNLSMSFVFNTKDPHLIFNIDGDRKKFFFDIGYKGDIILEPFKKQLIEGPFYVGVDEYLTQFFPEEDFGTGSLFLDDLTFYSPLPPGDMNQVKKVLGLMRDDILGTITLTEEEKQDNLSIFLDNWDINFESILPEIKSYISAYESENGPIFEDMDPIYPNEFNPEKLIQYTVQQGLHDTYFIKENIQKSTFQTFSFEDSKIWPGPISNSAKKVNSKITIDGNYSTDAKYNLNGQGSAYRMTGYYAAPGDIVNVAIDPSLTDAKLEIAIGTSEYNIEGGAINRFPRVAKIFKLDTEDTKIANPFGGPIYVKLPDKSSFGNIDINLSSVIKMPYFSIKSGNETDLNYYKAQLDSGIVRWVDWESENFMTTITLPMARHVDENLSDPTELINLWDSTFKVFQHVAGRPDQRIRSEYIRFDRMNPVGGTWAGATYPMYLYGYDPTDDTDAGSNYHVINVGFDKANIYAGGEFGYRGDHFIILHEMGHVHNMPTLPDEIESNVNFPGAAVYNLVFGETIDRAFEYSLQQNYNRDDAMMDWFISPNFRIGNGMEIDRGFNLGGEGFTGNEMMYQSRGHGKYIEIAALFGWDAVAKINKHYYNLGVSYGVERDDFVTVSSQEMGFNMAPLLHIWGTVPSDAVINSLSNMEKSEAIKERILHYRSYVPKNKNEFINMHNKMISEGKNPDGNKQRWEALAGSGYGDYPEYSEKFYDDIISQIDLILCIYYNLNCSPEVDTDGDGVPNDIDQCADTPGGVSVDANGCADTQKDSDGDGVPNDIDQCADTPSGASVDANGCEIPLFTEDVSFIESIYPNPTDDNLRVNVNPSVRVRDLYFVDLNGKSKKPRSVDRNQNELDVNVSNLQEGVYILEIVTDKKVNKVKIVIER